MALSQQIERDRALGDRGGRRSCGLLLHCLAMVAIVPALRYKRLGEEKLGKGSYGYVYPAWDTQQQCTVAVKVQPVDSDEAMREMMFFDVLPGHPNLITMLDKFVVGQELHLVFEYLYHSVSDMFHRAQGFLDVGLCSNYSRQIAIGLCHLHDHNVAHRDLSMGNILVDIPTNTVKIADLGLAACASHFVLDRSITTLWYRAPEVVLGVQTVGYPQTKFDMWVSLSRSLDRHSCVPRRHVQQEENARRKARVRSCDGAKACERARLSIGCVARGDGASELARVQGETHPGRARRVRGPSRGACSRSGAQEVSASRHTYLGFVCWFACVEA